MGVKIEEVESLMVELAQLPEKDIEEANRFKEKVITVISTLLPASEYRIVAASKINFNDYGMVIEAKEDFMLRAWEKGISQLQSLLEEVRHELLLVQKYHEPAEANYIMRWIMEHIVGTVIGGVVLVVVLALLGLKA